MPLVGLPLRQAAKAKIGNVGVNAVQSRCPVDEIWSTRLVSAACSFVNSIGIFDIQAWIRFAGNAAGARRDITPTKPMDAEAAADAASTTAFRTSARPGAPILCRPRTSTPLWTWRGALVSDAATIEINR